MQVQESVGRSYTSDEAAIKLQKVYKSFRTRRNLADCAVLIEQSLWNMLEFAQLKHSSISFFALNKQETALSRWSRARTRAAKVGKGLSKNGKARKLALQHWLEAIDPRHRYGHNLHFYYKNWLNSQSNEPFFYWLDVGEGKDVNLTDKCTRCKLQQQCIKYLDPMERKAYEVVVEDGKLMYKQTKELLNTTNGCKWIFVLSTSKILYVGKKTKGSFQHSSFLAGGATLAAGRIVAENGILKAVWPQSGHYRPTPENFEDFVSFLRESNVDLDDVKLDSIDDDEESIGKKEEDTYLTKYASDDDSSDKDTTDEVRCKLEETAVLEIPIGENVTDESNETGEGSFCSESGSGIVQEKISTETVTGKNIAWRINSQEQKNTFHRLVKHSCFPLEFHFMLEHVHLCSTPNCCIVDSFNINRNRNRKQFCKSKDGIGIHLSSLINTEKPFILEVPSFR